MTSNFRGGFKAINLIKLLEDAVQKHSEHTALISDKQYITYGQLNRAVNAVAGLMQKSGIGKGDKVTVMLPNIPEFVYCYFGIVKNGAVAVLINPLTTTSELIYLLNNSDSKILIIQSSQVKKYNEIKDQLFSCRQVIAIDAPEDPFPGADAQTVAGELVGPVAVLAGIPCRTEVFNRCLNRLRIGVENDGVQLPHAGQFCLDVPGSAGSDMALDAFHLGMWRVAPGGIRPDVRERLPVAHAPWPPSAHTGIALRSTAQRTPRPAAPGPTAASATDTDRPASPAACDRPYPRIAAARADPVRPRA